ncbi:MAG: hypothetical protein JW904_11265 [Spirochaetales bacterium]|nr:hypothetical protein [Spirochaetales bacterium]
MKRFVTPGVFIFFAFFCVSLSAQSTLPTNQVSFFWNVVYTSSADNAKYTDLIARAVLIEFEQKGFYPIPGGNVYDFAETASRYTKQEDIETTYLPALLEKATQEKSSFVAVVSYYKQNTSFILDLYVWNINGKRVFAGSTRARSSLEMYSRLSEVVQDFSTRTGKLAKAEPTTTTIDPDTGEEVKTVREGFIQQIVLYSWDEGAEIFVNSTILAGVITDGKLVLPYMPLAVNTRMTVEKRMNGYYVDKEEFVLDEEWMELRLRPMEKITTHEGLVLYSLGQFAGFGLGYQYYITPLQFFVGAENYFFLQFSDSGGDNTVFHDDIRVLGGMYLFGEPNSPFRLNLSAGAGVILTYIQLNEAYFFTDFYLNLLNISVEFRAWRVIFFIREEIKMGLGIGNNLLGNKFFFLRGQIPILTFGAKLPL